MCDASGRGDEHVVSVEIQDRLIEFNDRRARHNREHFERHGVVAVNLMGSPGSGKTALLEATARAFAGRRRLAALTGDLATDNDARRLAAAGIQSLSINMGSACHLDAQMVNEALHDLPWQEADYLFIENVGNLVCPAAYDLGQALSVVALSVTEGEDKPFKYPVIFRKAALVLLTKIDLLPHLAGPHLVMYEDALARVMAKFQVIPLSARSDWGLGHWIDWLETRRAETFAFHAPLTLHQ